MWAAVVPVLCSVFVVARGDLIDMFTNVSEMELSQLLDAYTDPPPRTTGFETLIPRDNVRLHCIKPSGTYFQEVFLSDTLDRDRKIDFSAPTTIVIHGWQSGSNTTLINLLTTNYLRYVKGTNYCLLDWKPYGEFAYQIAARQSAPLVAQQLFLFLRMMNVCKYSLKQVALIGFSMGAQIAGQTGKLLHGQIETIFALDPAGPLFTHPNDVGPARRLTVTDAKYVQVLYTSRFTAGMGVLVGTQNFLPNKGYHPQAPCAGIVNIPGVDPQRATVIALSCSHQYAVRLFSATLDPAHEIYAQKCVDIFRTFVCSPRLLPSIRVGFHAKRIPGNFYL